MNARVWSLRIAELTRRESCSLVDLLLALAEFDRLAVYRQLGFANLFDFLHREIGLSRGSAYYRQVASRLVGRFPELAEPLRDGRLCMSNVPQLAKVMTEGNRGTVVAKFFCSKQEARQVVAEILPAEVVPTRTVVTVVPLLAPAEPASVGVQPVERDRTHPEGMRPVTEVRRTVVEPLTRQESRMHVTVSPAFLALLKKAKAGQGHVQPGATDEQVLTAARHLQLGGAHRDRPRRPARSGWPVDRGELPDPLRRPQQGGGTASLRRRAHGPVRQEPRGGRALCRIRPRRDLAAIPGSNTPRGPSGKNVFSRSGDMLHFSRSLEHPDGGDPPR